MSELELVRIYFPRIDAQTASYLLWNMTCYPMSLKETKRQLAELRDEIRPTKRGWFRRLTVASRRIDRELMDALKQVVDADAYHASQPADAPEASTP